MGQATIRERLWLWGMRKNLLQEAAEYAALGFGRSTMTVEQAIHKTGIHNVIMAGGLPINQASLAAMPSARRIICKTSLHHSAAGQSFIDFEATAATLRAAKELAAADTRIEGFHVDDFSTGSIAAGVTAQHVCRLQFLNAAQGPQLPLSATIYTMSLEEPELPALLPCFAQYLTPLWHADQLDSVPDALERLAAMSGGKPMLLCLYLYDFGNGRPLSAELMDRHLDMAERLLGEERVTGMVMCGTCLMDLDWESNRRYCDWLDRVGDVAI